MKIVTMTYVRPSTAVAWAMPTPEFTAWNDAHKASLGLLSFASEESSDGLTKTIRTVYKSSADHDNFMAQPELIANKEERLAYCVANNISVDYNIELIEDENDPVTP
jgi:hypothetical protein